MSRKYPTGWICLSETGGEDNSKMASGNRKVNIVFGGSNTGVPKAGFPLTAGSLVDMILGKAYSPLKCRQETLPRLQRFAVGKSGGFKQCVGICGKT